MRIARRARTVALVLAAAAILAACGGDGGGGTGTAARKLDTSRPITLSFTFWGNDDRAARYARAIALFEKKYPNIDVQQSFQAFPDYWTARKTEAAGRALPDVLQMDMAYLRQFASNKLLYDLRQQSGVNLDTKGFDPRLLAAGQVRDALYAIPTGTNTLATLYNPALLKEVGVEPPGSDLTWEQYAQWAQNVAGAGAGHKPPIYGTYDFTTTFWFFLQNIVQQGRAPFTPDGRLGFTEADLKLWLDLGGPARAAKAFYPVSRNVQLFPKTGFTQQEAVSEISWDNFLAGYVADAGTEDLEMAPVPQGEAGAKQFFKPAMLLSAAARGKHPAAAAAFIDFMVNDPEVGAIFGTSRGVPAVKAQRDAMVLEPGSVDAKVVAYEESVADRVTEPSPLPIEGFGEVEAEFRRLGEELQYGRISTDDFAGQWFAFAKDRIKAP